MARRSSKQHRALTARCARCARSRKATLQTHIQQYSRVRHADSTCYVTDSYLCAFSQLLVSVATCRLTSINIPTPTHTNTHTHTQICEQQFPVTLNYLLTYLLHAAQSFFEKLTGSAASQEIPRIFGTRRFLTVPTSARHLSLFSANSIQSPQPSPTS